MLSNFGEFLRRIDQFGASYKPSYAYGEAQYKTSLGGLLSIVLYGLSLAYLVYELILWKEGKILPKVTSLQTEIETYSITFDQVASLCLRRHKSIEEQIDPFDPSNLILMPLLYEITDDVLGQPKPLLSTKKNEKHDTFMIEINDLHLQNNEHEQLDHPNIEYMLVFQSCVQNLLPEGWYCADENRVKQFFNQKQNQLLIQTFVNQYNTSTRQIDLVEQDYFAAFDNKTTYFSQVTVCTSNVSIDTGFLLESLEIVEFPSALQQYVQQMDLDYFTHIFKDEIYIVFEFELGTLQQTVFIEYPKVSEVLANIGSIISFFLFFSHVAYMVNEKTLELRVIRNLIEMYYPQFRDICFKKNFFGKIIEIKYKDNVVNLSFIEHYKKLVKVAEAKLCLTNSLYEISRLQFIIRSICDKEVIKNCHSIGIKLKQLDFEHEERIKNVNQNENEFVFKQDKIENVSVEDLNNLKINPQTTIDLKQQIVHFDQLNQSQSLFLGKVIQNQEQQDEENDLRLSDEDFYILMQNQPKIKDLQFLEQSESVLLQQQQQTLNLPT